MRTGLCLLVAFCAVVDEAQTKISQAVREKGTVAREPDPRHTAQFLHTRSKVPRRLPEEANVETPSPMSSTSQGSEQVTLGKHSLQPIDHDATSLHPSSGQKPKSTSTPLPPSQASTDPTVQRQSSGQETKSTSTPLPPSQASTIPAVQRQSSGQKTKSKSTPLPSSQASTNPAVQRQSDVSKTSKVPWRKVIAPVIEEGEPGGEEAAIGALKVPWRKVIAPVIEEGEHGGEEAATGAWKSHNALRHQEGPQRLAEQYANKIPSPTSSPQQPSPSATSVEAPSGPQAQMA